MKVKLVPKDDQWILVKSKIKGLVKQVYKITPVSYRVFDSNLNKWLVHLKKLRELVRLLEAFDGVVDMSGLPESWQEYVNGGPFPGKKSLRKFVKKDSPYSKLYLLDDAPIEVVKASYKALTYIYHPDQGKGDPDRLHEVIAAYKEIKNMTNT